MLFPGIYVIIAATINDAFGPDHYQVQLYIQDKNIIGAPKNAK